MSLAGKTVKVEVSGVEYVASLTMGDVTRFERVYKTAINRTAVDDEYPAWVIAAVIQCHLLRKGADVPTDIDDFSDALGDLEVVDEGKAEASDPTPPTG